MEEGSKTGCENDGEDVTKSKKKCRPTWRYIYVIITAIIQDTIEELNRIIYGKNCHSLHKASNHWPFDSLSMNVLPTELLIESWEYDTNNTISALQGSCGR